MKNKLAFIAAALVSVQCIAASAFACGAGQCTKNLSLSGLCSTDYANTSVFMLTNLATTGPTAADNSGCAGLHYTALVPGSTFETYGCVPTNSSVTITTPVTGTNNLEVYVDGGYEVTVARQLQCDCSGTPGGIAVNNACGICNGGTQGLGCDGQCNTKTKDACGICGGDGSSCAALACTQSVASSESIKSAASVTKQVKALYHRIPQFAKKAVLCDSAYKSKVAPWEKQGTTYVTQISNLLGTKITATTLSCPGIQCVNVSTAGTQKTLKQTITKLAKLAKSVKLGAIAACNTHELPHPHDPLVKDTTYYLNQALSTIPKLPATTSSCAQK